MDRATLIRHLIEAESLVSLAHVIVAQQRQLIIDMERDGLDTNMALGLLAEFEECLLHEITDRDRLKTELAAPQLAASSSTPVLIRTVPGAGRESSTFKRNCSIYGYGRPSLTQ